MVVSATEEWIIDKSALVRMHSGLGTDVWLERLQRGIVHVAVPTLLEIGYSARSGDDWQALIEQPPVTLTPVESITPTIEMRALTVQRALAIRGQHRGPSVPDLLVAAIAELAGLTVLHVDKDFELIAELTGQRVERLQLE